MYDASSPIPPEGFSLPIGLIAYKVSGAQAGTTVLVTLILPGGNNYISYLKYGAAPGRADDHWYEFTFNGTIGFLLDENIAVIQYMDGQLSDEDLEVNGIIEEESRLAGGSTTEVEDWNLYE